MVRFLVLGGAVASLMSAAVADARLAFRDPRPLGITLGTQETLASVSVCNTARAPLRRIRVVTQGFAFHTKKGAALPDARVLGPARLGADPPKHGPLRLARLPGSGCRTFALRKQAGAGKVAPGSYSGLVIAIARRGGIARRQVKLTVAGAEAPPTVTALSTSVTLIAHTKSPINKNSQLASDANVALVSTVEPQLPGGCDAPKAIKDRRCFVGNVSHGTDVAWVYISGDVTPIPAHAARDHAWTVPVRMVGADQVGEYKGTLDFGPGGKDSAPKVQLTVKAGDSKWWPILLVLVIQAVGTLLLLHNRRWRPHKNIGKQLDAFVSAYAAAESVYRQPGGDGRQLRAPGPTKINDHVGGIRKAADAYHKSTMLYRGASKTYQEVLKSLDEVQADIDCWREKLGPAMDALAAAAAGLPSVDAPALARKAAALLKEAELEVGEATAREQRANELTNAIGELALVVADLDHAADTLHVLNPVGLRDDARLRLERAEAILDGVHWRAWNATTSGELNAAGARAEIARAQRTLDELRHLLEDRDLVMEQLLQSDDILGFLPAEEMERLLTERPLQSLLRDRRVRGPLDITGVIGEVGEVISRAASSPAVREATGLTMDALIFAVTALAALILTITALDISDTFGTATDWLKLFAASVTGPIVGTAALEAVGRYRLMRADPLLRSEAEPATVST